MEVVKKGQLIMNKLETIKNFAPSGPGLKNGHFVGLPFEEDDAEVVLLPVPRDVTVSFEEGTAYGPENPLEASVLNRLFFY